MTVKPYEALLPELRSLKPEPSPPTAGFGGSTPAALRDRYAGGVVHNSFSRMDGVIIYIFGTNKNMAGGWHSLYFFEDSSSGYSYFRFQLQVVQEVASF